jgi:hypothetical protein
VADPQDPPGQEPNDDDPPGGGQGQTPNQRADDGDDGLGALPQTAQDEIRRLRGEARKSRLERNELRDKVKGFEDRDKSEEQRRQEQAAAADRRAADAEARLLKYEVAAELGISQHAGRLHGDTREALVEDAKALRKEFGLSDTNNGDGKPDFSSGVRRPVQRPKSMNDVIRQAAGR